MSRLKILSAALEELATIEDVISADRHEVINADNDLGFSFYITDDNDGWINETTVIGHDGDYFDIAKSKNSQASNGWLTCAVECEHISYRLNDEAYNKEFFAATGTPAAVLGELLAGTPFTVGTVAFAANVTYSSQQAMSRRALLVQFAELLGGELFFYGFSVSILAQRGSVVPKDLMAGRNIDVISKTVDKTKPDANGSPTVAYECRLVRPMALALGDVVTLRYAKLAIDVTLRIVSITTNPYNSDEVSFSVSNTVPAVEDAAYKIATQTVAKDAKYNGVRIGPEFGFEAVRNDKMARAYFRSDELKFQTGDGSGTAWTDKLYYAYDSDSETVELFFNGKMSATLMEALSAVITPNLYAGKATISELTVDQLDTSDKVKNYLHGNTSAVNYIRVFDQTIEFITASTDGSAAEQATNRGGSLLYWTDETHTSASEEETDFPIMMYVYEELIKLRLSFETFGENHEPAIVIGAGTGVNDNGKLLIYKAANGPQFNYYSAEDGALVQVKLTDDGRVECVGNTGAGASLRNIYVGEAPMSPQVNDLWIDTGA
jgi:hypothetical protein